MVRIGINGFGRIGRNIIRLARVNPQFELVMINDLTDSATLAHLLKYDSVHGVLPAEVSAQGDDLKLDGKPIRCVKQTDPAKIPWEDLGVEIVLECTGRFTDAEKAKAHLKGSVKKVIISAPAKHEDITVVMGVNEDKYDPKKHHILSNASCTTNCLAPVVKVLHQHLKLQRGFMTTIHAYTGDQRIHDAPHNDLRRARAGALNQIPTTTGAARAIGLVIPELKGKLDGMAIRVPTSNVSLVDLVCEVEKSTSVKEVNELFKQASLGELKGILNYCELPLVSSDYNGTTASSTIDALSTNVMDGRLVKVLAWYDNEIGFSQRMVDLTLLVAKKTL
ncbi:MAG: type I glyceraldehyde-3-phosphate dehydrogenase [Deltaproteobacteria bacterium]|nr:type I glyceraldehyde-3-phosphate dehydrogenase [Deltaproteobacteria bacterium]